MREVLGRRDTAAGTRVRRNLSRIPSAVSLRLLLVALSLLVAPVLAAAIRKDASRDQGVTGRALFSAAIADADPVPRQTAQTSLATRAHRPARAAAVRIDPVKASTTAPAGSATVTPASLVVDGCAEQASLRLIVATCPPYNAKGDNVTDDTTALQSALNAMPTSSGHVYIPPGTYRISATLTIANREGFIIRGAGEASTQIVPTTALAGATVVKFINCRDGVVEHLRISGQVPAHAASAAIEFHRAAVGGFAPTNMQVRNVLLGSDSSASLVNGIRFTAALDANNAEAVLENVKVINYSGAAVSIEHSNSLQNRIIGGVFTGDPTTSVGVRTIGGSFNMHGTVITVGDVDFDIAAGTQEHANYVIGVESESTAKILRTATTSGVAIYFAGYTKKGAPVGGATVIDFRSVSGRFSMVDSSLNLGQPNTIFNFSDSNTSVFFGGNEIGATTVTWSGPLTLVGNRWAPGSVTLTPGRGARLFQSGDTGGGFSGLTVAVGSTPITGYVSATAALTFGTIAANSAKAATIAVAGAAIGDNVYVSPAGNPGPGLVWSAYVGDPNRVTVTVSNVTPRAVVTTPRIWRADLWKH